MVLTRTCITPGCTGTANHTLRCPGCLAHLWQYSARGRMLPWQETPARQWIDLTDEEIRT